MFSSLNLPPIEESPATGPTSVTGQGIARATATTRRGNPAYRQFSAYVPDDLYRRFKSKLALENRDLSEVMEDLIVGWLK